MDLRLDVVSHIAAHRLQQADIKQVLQALSEQDREAFLERMADILGKVAALLEVAHRVSDTLSLDILLQRMMAITTEVIRADRSTLFLLDAETGELFSRVLQGDSTTEIRFPCQQGIAGAVFTSGEACVIDDAYADPRFNPDVDRQTGYRTRSLLCAPIKTRQQDVIGVIQLLNKHEGPFTADDLALLEAITSQAAAALQNAQLFEQVQKAHDEETRLLEVTNAISTELHLLPLLQKIMDTTTEILEADRSTLFMYDDKTDELWSQVVQGDNIAEIRFPSHLGIAGSVFTRGLTVNIPDAYADPRFNPDVDRQTGYRTRSILCLPVRTKAGETIGVIQVLNKRGGPFTRIDEKRLRAFAAQASIAIENAKLFDDVLNMKNYNESMLESMSDGIVTLDADRCIVKCNAAALRILHDDPERLIGQTVETYFKAPNDWVAKRLGRVLQTGSMELVMDTELWLHDGQQVSVNATIVPLRDAKHEPIGAMLVLADITTEKRIKGTLTRYMTKEVAEKLLESNEAMLGGQEHVASVLFADIRDFTTIAEQIGPQDTVSMLNDYFSIMVDIIFRYGGILDKYIGDAIMAVFGAPFSSGEDADRAVRTAVDMLKALRTFNYQMLEAGRPYLNIGVGISTDAVVSGNIGSPKRMDYTVIGDGVNLASRLEGANKLYRTRILISEDTFRQLNGPYVTRPIDSIRVRGKRRPVDIYEVLDYHDARSFPRLEAVLARYRQGLACYRHRHWEDGLKHFREALALNPADGPSQVYLDRCRYYLQTPPEASWDGVWVMQSK